MSSRAKSGVSAWLAACCSLLVAACEREPVAPAGAASEAPGSEPDAPCPKFTDRPKWGHGAEQFTIALRAPTESRTVELRGTGVLLTFGFGEFLRAAECLNQRRVVDYLRSRSPAEQVVNISHQESAQFLVPVAALLDAGHARVVAQDSDARVETIVKSFWTWMGCGGSCRHMGREYRLSIPGDVFLRITDARAHGRRSSE